MPNLRGSSPVDRDGGARSYVTREIGRSGAESAMSRMVDDVSRRGAVVLRGDHAAGREADSSAPFVRSSKHGHGINECVCRDVVMVGAEGRA